ncbi:unnamed protein product [Prorocentrum cordatum]|uniref:Apple domain-containing protein n=1 Tax=Prorocentrum cordatum TaxID=2364126 RepID=A0ABN9S1B5_9DINO|nr:unnamed protein product [Polarella glacialis]
METPGGAPRVAVTPYRAPAHAVAAAVAALRGSNDAVLYKMNSRVILKLASSFFCNLSSPQFAFDWGTKRTRQRHEEVSTLLLGVACAPDSWEWKDALVVLDGGKAKAYIERAMAAAAAAAPRGAAAGPWRPLSVLCRRAPADPPPSGRTGVERREGSDQDVGPGDVEAFSWQVLPRWWGVAWAQGGAGLLDGLQAEDQIYDPASGSYYPARPAPPEAAPSPGLQAEPSAIPPAPPSLTGATPAGGGLLYDPATGSYYRESGAEAAAAAAPAGAAPPPASATPPAEEPPAPPRAPAAGEPTPEPEPASAAQEELPPPAPATAAGAPPGAARCGWVEEDTYYPGNDLGVAEQGVAGADQCCARCADASGCVAWTYGKESQECALKGRAPLASLTKVPDPSYTSGQPTQVREPIPLTVPAPGRSLYCFALSMPSGPELELLQWQFEHQASLFLCDEYAVYSNVSMNIVPGLLTKLVSSDLQCEKGGEFGTALNLDIFVAVWTSVVNDGRFKFHDWTVKVDPDAVFFAARLRVIAEKYVQDLKAKPRGLYLNNCHRGPVEE